MIEILTTLSMICLWVAVGLGFVLLKGCMRPPKDERKDERDKWDKEFEKVGLCGCPNTPNYRHNTYDNIYGTVGHLQDHIQKKMVRGRNWLNLRVIVSLTN